MIFVDVVKMNVCRIKQGNSFGSGFLISDNQIITASHCAKHNSNEEIKVEFLDISKKKIKKTAKLSEYEDNKISILTINEPLKFEHLKIGKMNLERLDKCSTFGYPEVAKITGEWIDFKINNIVNNANSNELAYDIVLDINPSCRVKNFGGLSGSPLIIDETVVGVISHQTDSSNNALSVKAVDFKKCESHLNKNRIDLPSVSKKIKKAQKGKNVKISNKVKNEKNVKISSKTEISGNKIKNSNVNFGGNMIIKK